MANFNGLTFAAVPVTTGAGALATSGLTPGTTLIAGFMDPVAGVRIFNPQTEGNPVASSDNATKWLPVLASALSAATVNDQYWAEVPGSTQGANNKIGQVTLQLTPAAANSVEASSVMTYKLSPQAILLTATGSF